MCAGHGVSVSGKTGLEDVGKKLEFKSSHNELPYSGNS